MSLCCYLQAQTFRLMLPSFKLRCCPFYVHSTQEHMLWRGMSGLAKGSWSCLGKSESFSALFPGPVQVEESEGHRTDLAQMMLTSPSPRGNLASSCYCLAVMRSCRIQAGSSEDCLEPIKALMKCGCLDGRRLWRAWALVTRHSSLTQPSSDSSMSTASGTQKCLSLGVSKDSFQSALGKGLT